LKYDKEREYQGKLDRLFLHSCHTSLIGVFNSIPMDLSDTRYSQELIQRLKNKPFPSAPKKSIGFHFS
jgi:hypothetical protein